LCWGHAAAQHACYTPSHLRSPVPFHPLCCTQGHESLRTTHKPWTGVEDQLLKDAYARVVEGGMAQIGRTGPGAVGKPGVPLIRRGGALVQNSIVAGLTLTTPATAALLASSSSSAASAAAAPSALTPAGDSVADEQTTLAAAASGLQGDFLADDGRSLTAAGAPASASGLLGAASAAGFDSSSGVSLAALLDGGDEASASSSAAALAGAGGVGPSLAASLQPLTAAVPLSAADLQRRIVVGAGLPGDSAGSAALPTSVPWVKVADMVPGRSAKQCRDRWVHSLQPSLSSSRPWSEDEDHVIFTQMNTLGRKWAVIARQLTGRSALQVRNRYYSACRRIARAQLRVVEGEESGEADGAGLSGEEVGAGSSSSRSAAGGVSSLGSSSAGAGFDGIGSGASVDASGTLAALLPTEGLSAVAASALVGSLSGVASEAGVPAPAAARSNGIALASQAGEAGLLQGPQGARRRGRPRGGGAAAGAGGMDRLARAAGFEGTL
jgi:hypothetical protein